jgi:hypothetical protein
MAPHYHAIPKKPPPAVAFILCASVILWAPLVMAIVAIARTI